MKYNDEKELDIIVPICIDLNWLTKEEIIQEILKHYKSYGFSRFALASPSVGYRSTGYPSSEVFWKQAELFLSIKNELKEYPIDLGWWIATTFKSGPSPLFTRQVDSKGNIHPFSNCPLDINFKKQFAENTALFAEIAKPSFIVTEDDFTIRGAKGCFCEYHLKEFSKKQGRYFSREELVNALEKRTPEAIEIIRNWREVLKESLIGMAQALRKEIDIKSPEIPIGYNQAGGVDYDGAGTEEIARALAGPRHTPFSRLYGSFYGGFKTKELPRCLYHSLFSKQHINGDFAFYHETDTFPHTRHFSSGSQMRAMMGAVYSFGFDGSIFHSLGLLDNPDEETAYAKMFSKERVRFNTINTLAKKCDLVGVNIDYDPFWNTVDATISPSIPLWANIIGRFAIPYTTLSSRVSFWDERQAKYCDDETIMEALSNGLFLDADAAKALCKRGFGKYLGVDIGDDILLGNNIIYDLGAREVICEKFVHENSGRCMHSAHMLAAGGNGKLLKMSVTDDNCEVISEFYTYDKKTVLPAMTRFENSLGGKIVVMGITLHHNNSQSLINYRRQRLIQDLLVWCSDDFAFVKDAPDVYTIMNEAKDKDTDGFSGMLTVINLCEDDLEEVKIHLPKKWQMMSSLKTVNENGELVKCRYTREFDDIILKHNLNYLSPLYLIID